MQILRLSGVSLRIRTATVAVLFALSWIVANASVANAYCPGLSPDQLHTSGAAGKMDWQVWETGPQAVSALLNSYRPDPVVGGAGSWVMMSRWQNSLPSWAQTGWLRHVVFSPTFHYLFSQTASPDGPTRTVVLETSPTIGYHLYEAHHIGGPSHYRFFYDSSQWDSSQVVNWQPSRVEFGSESKNRADHFPGSTVNKIEFFNTSYKREEAWWASNLTYSTFGSYGIAGLEVVTSRTFRTYDTRCSD